MGCVLVVLVQRMTWLPPGGLVMRQTPTPPTTWKLEHSRILMWGAQTPPSVLHRQNTTSSTDYLMGDTQGRVRLCITGMLAVPASGKRRTTTVLIMAKIRHIVQLKYLTIQGRQTSFEASRYIKLKL